VNAVLLRCSLRRSSRRVICCVLSVTVARWNAVTDLRSTFSTTDTPDLLHVGYYSFRLCLVQVVEGLKFVLRTTTQLLHNVSQLVVV